jgi:siroheme synthase (precorrin-2 oxidase/ferrochelatase)
MSSTDRIVVIGTSAGATTALWRLCAAGARIRWFADRADIGDETVLAHALGGGRVELTFDDPLVAPLDGASAVVIARDESRDLLIAKRARASGVPVHFVDRPELSSENSDECVAVACLPA